MIPAALTQALRIPLPDRSGYWLLLGNDEHAPACPTCHRAMGLAIIHQVIDVAADPHITTVYSCVPCSTWRPFAIAA